VGSVRSECLDHVIVLGERHLHRIVKSYFAYYHRSRTHLSLSKDAPVPGSCARPPWARSWRDPRSVACTTGTSASQPDRRESPPSPRHLPGGD
jgi:hypothetical protein